MQLSPGFEPFNRQLPVPFLQQLRHQGCQVRELLHSCMPLSLHGGRDLNCSWNPTKCLIQIVSKQECFNTCCAPRLYVQGPSILAWQSANLSICLLIHPSIHLSVITSKARHQSVVLFILTCISSPLHRHCFFMVCLSVPSHFNVLACSNS